MFRSLEAELTAGLHRDVDGAAGLLPDLLGESHGVLGVELASGHTVDMSQFAGAAMRASKMAAASIVAAPVVKFAA